MAVRKPLLIAVIVITLVPAVVINSSISYVPLVFLALISLVSVLYTAILSRCCRLTVDSSAQRRYERETSVCYKIMVINKSFLVFPHISLSLCVENTQGLPSAVSDHSFMLRPKEKKELELPVHFSHIGRYNIKINRLRFYGFLGVFSFAVRPRWKEEVRITPKRYDMQGFKLNTSRPAIAVDFYVPYKINGGEYTDVREYAPGDPIKNIHWKLSAHTASYMTRIMRSDAVSGVSVYMDFCISREPNLADAADIYDCTVESAYSIALHALNKYYSVEFIYTQSNYPTIVFPKDQEELENAVYPLSSVSVKERFPLELLIAEHSNRPSSPDNIVVLTSTISSRLIDILTACKQLGKFPLLCHIRTDKKPLPVSDPTDTLLAGRKIEYHVIDSAGQLSRVLGGTK